MVHRQVRVGEPHILQNIRPHLRFLSRLCDVHALSPGYHRHDRVRRIQVFANLETGTDQVGQSPEHLIHEPVRRQVLYSCKLLASHDVVEADVGLGEAALHNHQGAALLAVEQVGRGVVEAFDEELDVALTGRGWTQRRVRLFSVWISFHSTVKEVYLRRYRI
jgi:hypothetical protein